MVNEEHEGKILKAVFRGISAKVKNIETEHQNRYECELMDGLGSDKHYTI